MARAEELKVYALGGRRVVFVRAGRGEGLRAHLGSRGFPTGAVHTPVSGLDRLELADQYAPVSEARRFGWPEAVEIVDASFTRFSPRLAEIFRACLEAGHVDAAPRVGKAGGAYCTTVSKQVLPYVLLNFNDRFADVTTLAHEFGHATHSVLALERQALGGRRDAVQEGRHSLRGRSLPVQPDDKRHRRDCPLTLGH